MTATMDRDADEHGDDGAGLSGARETSRIGAPRGWTLVALVAALCFLAGAIGWTVASGRPPGADTADVGFLRDMRTHHENAINIAQIELVNGSEPAAKVFAEEIIRFQAYEIGLMDRTALDWGHRPEDRPDEAMAWMGEPVAAQQMPGIASDEEMELLRDAEAETDAVFVALMIDHHRAGVVMAEAAADLVDDDRVRQLAARIARTQALEIAEMTAVAERLGLDPVPEGVTPDDHGASEMADHEAEDS